MTVTVIYEQGTIIEPFDETVRAYFAREWNDNATLGVRPHFVSPNGNGKDESDYSEPLTKNDIEVLQVDGLIKFESKEQRLAHGGRGKSGKTFSTRIDITIYAINRQQSFAFMKEFNRIISDNRPNTSLRIKKTDNQNDSAVAYFEQSQVDFAKPQNIGDSSHLTITTGFLNARWMINET